MVPDHLTSIWVPRLGEPFAAEFVRLEELARALRARCPWDRVQTHQSLTRYLLEESYEALEAIEELGPDGAGYEHLEEELGDVLFQVVFHSVLAAEEGQFALGDVARNVHDKLVGRHPHVFGDVEAKHPRRREPNWEQIKRKEKGRPASWTTCLATCRPFFMPTKSRGRRPLWALTGTEPRAPCPK